MTSAKFQQPASWRKVQPYVGSAWVDRKVDAELEAVERRIMELLREVTE